MEPKEIRLLLEKIRRYEQVERALNELKEIDPDQHPSLTADTRYKRMREGYEAQLPEIWYPTLEDAEDDMHWYYIGHFNDLLEKRGWKCTSRNGYSLKAEKDTPSGGVLYFEFTMLNNKQGHLKLERSKVNVWNGEIGNCTVSEKTKTEKILDMLDEYSRMPLEQMKKEAVILSWQDREFYKAIVIPERR